MKMNNALTMCFFILLTSCGQNDGAAPSVSSSNNCSSCKIFVTTATYNGNLGGIAGADAKCMSDTSYPGSGTYKALLFDRSSRYACTTANCSGGISENKDWVLHSNATYKTVSGSTIFSTNSVGIFVFGTFTNPITASAVYGWSGMDYSTDWITDITSTAHTSCSDWTSSSGAESSTYGTANNSDNSVFINFADWCSSTAHLYCVEQ